MITILSFLRVVMEGVFVVVTAQAVSRFRDRVRRGGMVVMCALMGPALGVAADSRVVAYVPTWSDIARLTATIPFRQLTHLNIAFINPTNDAGVLEDPAGVAALVTKAHQQRVQVLFSLGGGSVSEDPAQRARYATLIAPARRVDFIRGIVAYVQTHGYDGVDIDLEGPAIGADYGGFIVDLSTALQRDQKLLTAALSAGYGGDKVPATALACFDFVNLMAYDATGPWTPDAPGPHASVAQAQTEVAFWKKRGVAKDRIVLGVPFYGYEFKADHTVTSLPFSAIMAQHPGAEQHDQIGTLFYNGMPAMRAKVALVKSEGLGGIMIWSLDQDAAGAASLLGEIARALGR